MSLISVVFAAVIVVLIALKLREMGSGYGILMSIGACVMVMYFVIGRFRQIAGYIDRLVSYVSVDITYIDIILKMIGIAYICQFATDICRDAGYQAIASQVEMAGKISLILLSMPVLMSVIDLVVAIVEG
ncbi:MAG: SpoIIIAC/SpoIIIAD family protein [Clostridiales bacterium]|nr:SpoIIIAC/SpoIIIAD family protein [Clostridiales bacterium]